MKLHRDLGVTQKTAWMMAQKIREAWTEGKGLLSGDVEMDETYIGGKYSNMHKSRKPRMSGAGPQDKTPVVAIKERESKKIKAKVTKPVSSITLQRMVQETVEEGSTVYTDQNRGYIGLKRKNYGHEAVNHSVGEYVREQAHTNGVESFCGGSQEGLLRNLSPYERETLRPLCCGVCRSAQHQGNGHHRPDDISC